MTSTQKGRVGEESAAAFLRDQGYLIVDQNFRWRGGEIDIVAQRGEVLAFCEVKHWSVYDESAMEYAIGAAKQRRILIAAKTYLDRHPEFEEHRVRFDVLFLGPDGETRHIPGAFTEN